MCICKRCSSLDATSRREGLIACGGGSLLCGRHGQYCLVPRFSLRTFSCRTKSLSSASLKLSLDLSSSGTGLLVVVSFLAVACGSRLAESGGGSLLCGRHGQYCLVSGFSLRTFSFRTKSLNSASLKLSSDLSSSGMLDALLSASTASLRLFFSTASSPEFKR